MRLGSSDAAAANALPIRNAELRFDLEKRCQPEIAFHLEDAYRTHGHQLLESIRIAKLLADFVRSGGNETLTTLELLEMVDQAEHWTNSKDVSDFI